MKRVMLIFAALLWAAVVGAAEPERLDINQTVVRIPLAEGVTMDDAVASMKLRANMLNMMFVAHQPLGEQVRKMGHESRRLDIFQFCDPLIARRMVDHNDVFAAYMPCRIALVEEPDGGANLLMLDLDMLIEGSELSPELRELADEVNGKLTEIMQAGAAGEL